MPEIQMPKLSDTMTEGTLVAWKKKKGDQVAAGDVIAEIETDKATMEWESPEDGTLTEIYVEEGGKVEVGQKIAFIGEKGEGDAPEEKPKAAEEKPAAEEKEKPAAKDNKKEETAPPEKKKEAPREDKKELVATANENRVNASPVARRLAGELGVDLATIKGTGPDGRITESDIRAAGKSGGGQAKIKAPVSKEKTASSSLSGTRIPLTGMRKVIAERLVESKGPVPHFYLNIDVDATALVSARAELKAAGEESDTAKITVNDFLLKAAVEAAVKVPKANAAFAGDAIVQFEDVDLALAVAIEDGLVTPVIRAAQQKSLRELSEAVKDLAHRARHKRMKPEEFQGGSFTVSNLGSYGIDYFSAIINPPQAFILSVGAIRKKPTVDDCDQIVIRSRLEIGMSCDHRVIDGALGAEYLKELRRLIENPTLLLLE